MALGQVVQDAHAVDDVTARRELGAGLLEAPCAHQLTPLFEERPGGSPIGIAGLGNIAGLASIAVLGNIAGLASIAGLGKRAGRTGQR